MLYILPKGTEIRAFVLCFHKISCIQALICCKFLLVLSNPLKKVYVRYLFRLQLYECSMLSIMNSVITNLYCLPELNATKVIQITERNKMQWPIAVRLRVETKFPFRKRFLVSCLSKENECNKLVNVRVSPASDLVTSRLHDRLCTGMCSQLICILFFREKLMKPW